MTLGDIAWLRKHIGDLDITDVADSELTIALNYGTSEVNGTTLKTDWETSTSHPLYNKVVTTVHYFASFYILDRLSGDQTKTDNDYERAKELLTTLKLQLDAYDLVNDTSSGGSGSKFGVVKTSFKSYPKNLDADPFKSQTVRHF